MVHGSGGGGHILVKVGEPAEYDLLALVGPRVYNKEELHAANPKL